MPESSKLTSHVPAWVVAVWRYSPRRSPPQRKRMPAWLRTTKRVARWWSSLLLLVLAAAGLIALLLVLDWFQDPHSAIARQQIEYAQQSELIRRCLAADPFIVVESKPEPRVYSKAPARLIDAKDKAIGGGDGQSNGLPRRIKLYSLVTGTAEDLSDARSIGDEALLRDVERCAHVWKTKQRGDDMDSLWLRAHVFEPGSSLYAATRLLRLVVIGLLTVCAIEIALRLLAAANVPVATLRDIALGRIAGAKDQLNTGSTAAKALGWPRIVGTSLVAGVTGLSVLVPELRQQLAHNDRIEVQREARAETVRSEKVLSDTQRVYVVDRASGDRSLDVQQLLDQVELLHLQFAILLRDQQTHALNKQQWEVLSKIAATGGASLQDRTALTGIRRALRDIDAGVRSAKTQLGREIHAVGVDTNARVDGSEGRLSKRMGDLVDGTNSLLTPIGVAATASARAAANADRHAAVLLDYSSHVECSRWFFRTDAQARLGILQSANEPKSGSSHECDEMSKRAGKAAAQEMTAARLP